MTATSCHITVLAEATIDAVLPASPRVIVDGTFGGGGHTGRLLDRLDDDACSTPSASSNRADVIVIGLDRDPEVIRREEHSPRVTKDPRVELFLGSYERAGEALRRAALSTADALILDLGLSSDQLADRSRGFSFTAEDAELDLRFDDETGTPAHRWLAQQSEKQIADAIYQFGEERYSRRIARQIVQRARQHNAVRTVGDLVGICRRCVPRSRNHDIHPATRTFQALRIAVNDELGALQRTLASAPEWMSAGGRAAVISFHSLEDRIVKHAFRDDDRWEVITRKPIRPTEEEQRTNPRSRSAKLRVAQRVAQRVGPNATGK